MELGLGLEFIVTPVVTPNAFLVAAAELVGVDDKVRCVGAVMEDVLDEMDDPR